ncbi:MAG: hypothetical protein ACRC33_21290 [Gemmataceae bacterium]
MPLRDHFQPPIAPSRQWFSTLMMFASTAMRHLHDGVKIPKQFIPDLDIKRGEFVESAYVPEGFEWLVSWQPEEPHAAFDAALPAQDRVELRYHDESRDFGAVTSIHFVTPDNKRDQVCRRSFAIKCAERLRQGYSIVVVDLVTIERHSLLTPLAELVGITLPGHVPTGSPSAFALRAVKSGGKWRLDLWSEPCAVGRPLPTLPLWLADDIAVPLELEPIYEATCQSLRIP